MQLQKKITTEHPKEYAENTPAIKYLTWGGWGSQGGWRGRFERTAKQWIPCQKVTVPLSIVRVTIGI